MNSHPTLPDISSACVLVDSTPTPSFGEIDADELDAIVGRMRAELKKATAAGVLNLNKGRLLIPNKLIENIAAKLLELAHSEIYGPSGCKLYMLYDNGVHCQVLGSIKFDDELVTTFSLFLTLREELNSIHGRINHLWRRACGGGTLKLSKQYDLEKRKFVVSEKRNRHA